MGVFKKIMKKELNYFNLIKFKEILGLNKNIKIMQISKSCLENPCTNYGDKKPQSLRPLIYNPLYDIKVQRFTLLFYPKNLYSNTYT